MVDPVPGEQPRLEHPLRALTRTRGVLGAVLATEDGLLLAASLDCEQDAEALAAAAAAMARSSSRALIRVGCGELQMAMLEASKLRFLVRGASGAYLLVVAEPHANVGLIVAEMDAVAVKLGAVAVALLEG